LAKTKEAKVHYFHRLEHS